MRAATKIFVVGVAVTLAAWASPVRAQQVLLDWGPDCFGWEAGYANHISQAGEELTLLGKIDAFYDHLAFLDPDVNEYTFIFEDLISLGTVVTDSTIFETAYEGGTFRIYEDTTPDFDFGINPPNATAPGSFVDGELIMEGTLDNFEVVIIDLGMPPGATGSAQANWVCTGGSLYSIVGGCYGPMLGTWTDDPNVVPIPEGYTCHEDGKFDWEECPPTPSESGTWGRIKELYR